MNQPSQHAVLQPSAAGRWGAQCPGSTALEAAHPETERTPEAREGDAAHWIGAESLRQMQQFNQAQLFKSGMADPTGTIIDDEMIEAADMFASGVLDRCGRDALKYLHIEEKLTMHDIHPANEGTPDVWWIIGGNKANLARPYAEIFLEDFKYGHKFIEVFENWQLIDYAKGVMNRCAEMLAGIPPEMIRFNLTVVQPRSYGRGDQTRTWTTTAAELQPYWDALRVMAYKAMGPGAPTIAGPACLRCRGIHACETNLRAGEAVRDYVGTAIPLYLTPEAMAVEMRYLQRASEILKARIIGLDAEMQSNIRNSIAVPGWGIEQGMGRLAWTVEPQAAIDMASMMGVNISKGPAVITPVQAIKAGLPKAIVESMATKPKGEFKLVPADTSQARKVFG